MKLYVNIRIWILLLALKMKWSVQCQLLHKLDTDMYTPLNSMELRTHMHTPKSTQVLQSYVSAQSHAHARHARHSRVFTPEFGDSLTSVASVTRAPTL